MFEDTALPQIDQTLLSNLHTYVSQAGQCQLVKYVDYALQRASDLQSRQIIDLFPAEILLRCCVAPFDYYVLHGLSCWAAS